MGRVWRVVVRLQGQFQEPTSASAGPGVDLQSLVLVVCLTAAQRSPRKFYEGGGVLPFKPSCCVRPLSFIFPRFCNDRLVPASMKRQYPSYPATFIAESRVLEELVLRAPSFRGHIPVLASLCRLLPFSTRARMQIGMANFPMDLGYPTHLSCFKIQQYEPLESLLVHRTLGVGDWFFDLGANWGYFSALASRCVGLSGKVLAVEANPVTFRALEKMLGGSGAANVQAINCAVSDRDLQPVTFSESRLRSDAFGHIGDGGLLDRRHEVQSRTLDSLWTDVGRPSVRMLKIDVEGMEPKVLAGARACVSEGVSHSVLVEINDWTPQRCGEPYEACYELMQAYGFAHAYEPTDEGYNRISGAVAKLPVNKTILFTRAPFFDAELVV